MKLEERFLRYVAFPTASCEESETCPSTSKQRALGEYLTDELLSLGLNARMDHDGYVYGTLAANTDRPLPKVGLIAHMDTSPDAPDSPIHPRKVRYTGEDIPLNKDGTVLPAADLAWVTPGEELLVTDGRTLLGADDKAGVAEIMTALERLIASGAPHGEIRVAFTPDEEIGRGADRFDVPGFDADYAYTVDGGTVGEIEYENFNAASGRVEIRGFGIHPGSAKGKMVNAAFLAAQFATLLPREMAPECTDGYEGFFHLHSLQGDVEQARADYIIRDHDRAKFEAKKQLFVQAGEYLNTLYGPGTVTVTVTDSYYNMKEKLLPCMEVVERAKTAMRLAGMHPVCVPIRGGTDGARLSYMGLPCPNLCTGGAENMQGE